MKDNIKFIRHPLDSKTIQEIEDEIKSSIAYGLVIASVDNVKVSDMTEAQDWVDKHINDEEMGLTMMKFTTFRDL